MIGQAIRARRQALDLSSRELARRAQLPESTIRAVEKLRKSPSVRVVQAIARALGSTVEQLAEPPPAAVLACATPLRNDCACTQSKTTPEHRWPSCLGSR